jgi:hypothetical protein
MHPPLLLSFAPAPSHFPADGHLVLMTAAHMFLCLFLTITPGSLGVVDATRKQFLLWAGKPCPPCACERAPDPDRQHTALAPPAPSHMLTTCCLTARLQAPIGDSRWPMRATTRMPDEPHSPRGWCGGRARAHATPRAPRAFASRFAMPVMLRSWLLRLRLRRFVPGLRHVGHSLCESLMYSQMHSCVSGARTRARTHRRRERMSSPRDRSASAEQGGPRAGDALRAVRAVRASAAAWRGRCARAVHTAPSPHKSCAGTARCAGW